MRISSAVRTRGFDPRNEGSIPSSAATEENMDTKKCTNAVEIYHITNKRSITYEKIYNNR